MGCLGMEKVCKKEKLLQRHPVITNLPLPRQIEENCNSNSPRQCLPSVGSVCCARVSLVRGQRGKERTRKETTFGDLFSCWLPLTCLHVFGHRTLRQTSSLAALVGRISKEILPPSAPVGRAGWSVRVQEGERQNKSPEAIASRLCFGSPCWTRTSDTLINSQVLYRLS